MRFIIFSLIFACLTNLSLTEPAVWTLPTDLQNYEVNDITSLEDEFSSIINKIKVIGNQLYCPKEWRHFGGSCYYLSKTPIISAQANYACNLLHSNRSKLMKIRNSAELSYAARMSIKNNLSTLMIEIDPDLLKGTIMTGFSPDDQEQWQRTNDRSRELRTIYRKLRGKIIDQLNFAGLPISRRSKETETTINQNEQKSDHDTYEDKTIYTFPNEIGEVDKRAYDTLDFEEEEESDEFEQMQSSLCDIIKWNVINNDSTIYRLTISSTSNKTVCLLSNVKSDIQYRYVCQYVFNFCFANFACGKHGRCTNTLSGFKCSCSYLYDGLRCEKISNQGKQIIIACIIIIVLFVLSIKPVQCTLMILIRSCIYFCTICGHKKRYKKEPVKHGTQKLISHHRVDEDHEKTEERNTTNRHRPVIHFQERVFSFLKTNNPIKHTLIRSLWTGGLWIVFLILVLFITTVVHQKSTKHDIVNDTMQLIPQCHSITSSRTKIFIFSPIALVLLLIFSWTIKREQHCLHLFHGRPGLLPSIQPFSLENRFTTAAVFGIIAFEILKTFERFLFNTHDPLKHGIFSILLEIIGFSLLIGLWYHPILVSLQLRNIIVRFIVCLYVSANIIYRILFERSCTDALFIPESYSTLKTAKVQTKFDLEFIIIRSLIKNIPYFILISYLAAELFVRFAYDSLYISIKTKQSIWSPPTIQPDRSVFARSYVTKLFRRNFIPQSIYSNDSIESEHETKLPRKSISSNNDFHLTTLVLCIYTVAVVVLYYLAYTFVLGYVVKTEDHIPWLQHYLKTTYNIEFQGFFSLKVTVIMSAIIALGIIILQFFAGLESYKRHKMQLCKGIYTEIPSAFNFQSTGIVLNSTRYFGFFVGHVAFGFILLFHLSIFIFYAIRRISLHRPYMEFLLSRIVPVLVMYLLTMVIISSVGKLLFISDMKGNLRLQNRRIYGIFVYLTCFLDGIFSLAICIIRFIKATIFNTIHLTRLDYSIHGRPSEKFDVGFAAYISYLHMEIAHTNPIMLAFCYSLNDDIIARRPENRSASRTLMSLVLTTELDRHEIIRKKRARFRWHLVYTILRNYHLFDLRKYAQSCRALLYRSRSSESLVTGERKITTPESPISGPSRTKKRVLIPEIAIHDYSESSPEERVTPAFFEAANIKQVDSSPSTDDN